MKTLKNLKYCMVDVKPVDRDWSEGYPEKWDFFAASKCEKCGEIIVGRNGERHSDIDCESECDGHVPENDGPMMNHSYGLPDFDGNEDSAKLIVDLPLVLVRFEDSGEWALALSGGGMDLSWEICEAYMLLGYFPPSHFAEVPQMSSRGRSARDRWILAGARKSLQCQKQRASRALRRLRENFKSLATA